MSPRARGKDEVCHIGAGEKEKEAGRQEHDSGRGQFGAPDARMDPSHRFQLEPPAPVCQRKPGIKARCQDVQGLLDLRWTHSVGKAEEGSHGPHFPIHLGVRPGPIDRFELREWKPDVGAERRNGA